MSMGSMACSLTEAMCSTLARTCRMPPWTLGVEGLDAAVEHFGEAGEVGDVADREAGFAQGLGRAAGGDEVGAVGGEGAGELK